MNIQDNIVCLFVAVRRPRGENRDLIDLSTARGGWTACETAIARIAEELPGWDRDNPVHRIVQISVKIPYGATDVHATDVNVID